MARIGQAGLLSKWNCKPSKKGTGLEQPLTTHQHWHIDVSYINISGTFYYLSSNLDGCSRYIVNWDLRESMSGGRVKNDEHTSRFAGEVDNFWLADHLDAI